MAEPSYYTAEEIAQILKISRFTVYEMIKRGELKAYRIGRKVRVEVVELDQYIRKAKNQTEEVHASLAASSGVEYAAPNPGFIIYGQDSILDILTRHLRKQLPNVPCWRNYSGSFEGLLALYSGTANAVTAHLWDSDTDDYNVPYVRLLLPGHRTLIFNLAYRMEGFYVARGNPKNILTWRDLTRDNVRLVNREPGSGARVLLDKKLHMYNIERGSINGYEQTETSHLAVASCVARGEADVGLGIEKAALQTEDVDFIPQQKERYDLIVRKEEAMKPQFQTMIAILQSKAFHNEILGMGGYDVSKTGTLIAET